MTQPSMLLLSGEIAAGKSSVAAELAALLPGRIVTVRQILAARLGVSVDDRRALQVRGADLDRKTAGRWLLEELLERAESHRLVIDSIRTVRQCEPILERVVDARLLYIQASESVRRQRYLAAQASDAMKAAVSFDTAAHHPTEQAVHQLIPLAHLVVPSDDLTPSEIARLCLDAL